MAWARLLNGLYAAASPLILRTDAQQAHHAFLEGLRFADNLGLLRTLTGHIGRDSQPQAPVTVGGVDLPHPFILSAGMVKGDGFRDEAEALAAVDAGRNIIPGWAVLPKLVGPVEFGSFTRHPRLGNTGRVLWRDVPTRSTQNRIGLRNPGAVAAAAFLARHRDELPPVFGVNIAVSPGVSDPDQERAEALDAVRAFIGAGVRPSWWTLNLSCPNTEDDPMGNQTEAKARDLCAALIAELDGAPLWVKVGPCLSDAQYAALMSAFAEVGVKAVIATNTLPESTPDGTATAGVGGGRLHAHALDAVRALSAGGAVDIIGCGGVCDAATYRAFMEAGAKAVQYYSALVYRGPLVANIIDRELHTL